MHQDSVKHPPLWAAQAPLLENKEKSAQRLGFFHALVLKAQGGSSEGTGKDMEPNGDAGLGTSFLLSSAHFIFGSMDLRTQSHTDFLDRVRHISGWSLMQCVCSLLPRLIVESL